MKRLSWEARQIDLSARYRAYRIGLLFMFYCEDVYTPCGIYTFEDIAEFSFVVIVVSALLNAGFCIQYEKENVNELIVFANHVYDYGLIFFKYLAVISMYFAMPVVAVTYSVAIMLSRIFGGLFNIWKPFFKKNGYLSNFFKKKK